MCDNKIMQVKRMNNISIEQKPSCCYFLQEKNALKIKLIVIKFKCRESVIKESYKKKNSNECDLFMSK